MTDKHICNSCDNEISSRRFSLGYDTCLECGEVTASKRKFTVVPMHKSNYVVITNREELKGINNKGGSHG